MHRIYFSNVHNGKEVAPIHVVKDVLQACEISGCTLISATGWWEGTQEPSYIIEVAFLSDETVRKLAEALKEVFEQDAVLVSSPQGEYIV